jgi:catechol 2,3-dioxygenase-like lactoylglutathione lyase family enzyme
MILNVSLVTVYCLDQDKTRDFYVDHLGFEPRADVTMGEGFRWVTIGHPSQPEQMGGLGLRVDDCRKTYEELSARGVTFVQEPSDRPYGVEAVLRDNTGNWLVLMEPKAYTPDDFK